MSENLSLSKLRSKALERHKQKKQKMKENFLTLMKEKKIKKQMLCESSVSSDDDSDEYFVWEKYLERQHAKPVSKTAFKHIFDTKMSGFKSGMKVEAKDQTSFTDSYWVATVVMVSGPLLLLRFDGYDEDRSGDFWLDSSSELLQPIGWCAKTNNILIPPETIRHKKSNWAKFLVENLQNAVAAPDNLFHVDNSDNDDTTSFLKVGECLEIQDDDDPLCYWPAVIIEKYNLRLRLRYSGYEEEEHDIWEYYFSHRIHNLGWGRSTGLILSPPKVMEKYSQWKIFKDYVKLCQFQNSSTELGKLEMIPKFSGLEPGMKLEVVNPQEPSSLCVGSIKEILSDHFFNIEIQNVFHKNQPLECLYHARSKYLFPVGWSERNNVTLKPPKGMSTFDWAEYLDKTQSEPAPESLFDKDLEEFKVKSVFSNNDVVEIVNREDPSCYWIATVVGHGIKYHLRYYGTSVDVSPYRFADVVHPLGWGKANGLRFKPPNYLTIWDDEAKHLEDIFKSEDMSPSPMKKLDTEDNLPGVHGFKVGMQLEAINPQDPSSICVASVIECNSKHYFTVQIDDFIELNQEKKLTFWCHTNSKNIYPVGWCKKNNVQLIPPPGNPYKEFLWEDYMKSKKTSAAPEELFSLVPPSSDFEVSQKLEAVDQTNQQTISVATITQVVGGMVWIRLDGYQSNAVEQIYDVESFNLFPVGWSSMNGHPLLSPKLKKNDAEPRKWSTSLRKRSSSNTTQADSSTTKRRKTAAKPTVSKPDKLTNTNIPISVVVKSNKDSAGSPTTSGIATPSSSTMDDTDRLRVSIHEVETNTTPENDTFKPTTTIDLTDDYSSVADTELLLFIRSSCSCGPFLNKNKLSALPSKFGPAPPNTILKQIVEQVVLCASSRSKVLEILSSEKEKQSFLSILKTLITKLEICENLFSLNKINSCSRCDKDPNMTKPRSPTKATSTTFAKPSSTTNSLPSSTTNTNSTRKQPSKLNSPISKPSTSKTIESRTNNSRTVVSVDDVIGNIPDGYISTWTIDDVIQFVSPRGCNKFTSVFQEQEVDGKALMLLSLDDIHKVLGVTLGPAIKLHDDVQKLRYKKH